jgi:4-alpha-glucanotransferase
MMRRAGISVPLFSLRSSRSWGIGEIGDIPLMAAWLGEAHQSVLQILPLNELSLTESSPYSALSAMAIDPRYISVRLLEGGAELEARWKDEIDAVRNAPSIDHARVRNLKERALRASFEHFYESDWRAGSPEAELLRNYSEQEAWWLDEYSLYRALRRYSGEIAWTDWETSLRDRDPEALGRMRRELAIDVLYFRYVQWIAETQWQSVRQALPGLQLLGDYPFMVTPDSADVWSRREDFILDASVGTPPDAFSDTGQEWGLPPYNWEAARLNDFAWLRARASRLASLYDGFRVDHLVGFYRTYVRPLDGRESYFFPAEEEDQRELGETVLRIMMQTGADVSVEDLGTVPDFVRESFARLGLPGYKVIRWEPLGPETYPSLSVAMTGTHDTETLAVWWEALTPDERVRWEMTAETFDDDVRDRLLRRTYDAGSDLVLVPLQDVFGWRDRINTPATISPANWSFALPWTLEKMLEEPVARDAASRLTSWGYRSGRWIRSDTD